MTITSVHVADIGRTAPLFRPPKPSKVAGLLSADAGLTAALSGKVMPRPDFTRIAMVAFWESEEALDRFIDTDPIAAKLASGWSCRLEAVRAFGHWPGLPEDIRRSRKVETDGPVVVTTLGRLKLSQTKRFLQTSALAEGRVVKSPGRLWSTGFSQPPFVGTISVWESAAAAADYAYGDAQPEHSKAIDVDRAKGFHNQMAFIRYRPLASTGHLGGANPMPELTF